MKRTPIVAVLIVGLMLIAVVPSAVQAYTPQPAKAPIEPNPMLEGNVTMSIHQPGWASLEYNTQYGTTANLTASTDARDLNPYQVNPTLIQAPGILQGEMVGNTYWNTTSAWSSSVISTGAIQPTPNGGAVYKMGVSTYNGEPAVYQTLNTSASGNNALGLGITFENTVLPSTNPAFDFITIGFSFTQTGSAQGTYVDVHVDNGTSNINAPLSYNLTTHEVTALGAPKGTEVTVQPTGYFFFSASLAQLSSSVEGLNLTAGPSYDAGHVEIVLSAVVPQTSVVSTTNLTVTDVALSEFPMTLGQYEHNTSVGANTPNIEAGAVSNSSFSTFAPSFAYKSITGGGYTVAIEQAAAQLPSARVSISQTPISSGNYAEQLTYSFLYGLPTAPSLTYDAFKFIDHVNLAPAQYISVTYAGTSYLTDYTAAHAQGNYTTLVSSASPTNNESWVGTVQYTQAQWNSISAPPGFFTVPGINYLWFVLIGVIAGLVGLGSAWASKGESASRIRGRGR